MGVLKNFCTPMRAPPYAPAHQPAAVDEDLFTRVKASIETFVSDAASDEIRAGKMLAGHTVFQVTAASLPSLRLVIRDKPHAVRRLTSRGWRADPFLNEVQQRFVFGEKSPARLIQFF